MIFSNLRIKRKLLAIIMLICSGAMMLMGGAYILFEFSNFKSTEKDKVATLALAIASNSSAALAFDSPKDATEILHAFSADKYIVAAALYDKRGRLFAKYPQALASSTLPPKTSTVGYIYKENFIEGFQEVAQGEEHLGTLYIKSSMDGVYSQMRTQVSVVILLIIVCLLLSYFLSDRLQRSISVPILALERLAKDVSERRDYSARAKTLGRDEIGALTAAFNDMLGQIESQNQQITAVSRESSKLAAIVESSTDVIIGSTVAYSVTSWNNGAYRTLGFNRDEMVGEPIARFIGEHDLKKVDEAFQRSVDGHESEPLDVHFISKDGNRLEISLTVSPVKDSEGIITGISYIGRDVTIQKENERRIIRNEEHLRLATQSAELGTFDMDLVDGTMLWDKRCRELFGIYHDDIVTYEDDFLGGLHPEDRQRIEKAVANAYDRKLSNGNYDVEYRTVSAQDNRVRWIRAKGKILFDYQEVPVRFIGSVIDITNKKQDELRKNDFIAIISHELKTPLTSIKSYVQIMLSKVKKDGDSFAINALTRADAQTRKMTSMITDFLNLAKIEEGKITMNKEEFNLNGLLEDIVQDAQLLTTTHKIVLVAEEPVRIFADRDKICQVLINLATNAFKYSPVDSTITITSKVADGKVTISVKDDGVGISLKDQEKLFTRFYRVDNEKIKTVSGFGIGLYIVSEILRYHNSEIKVESMEEAGSRFYFSLDVIT